MGWFGIYEILKSKDYQSLVEFLKDSEDGKDKLEEACEQLAVDAFVSGEKPVDYDVEKPMEIVARFKKEIYAETVKGLKEFGYGRV